MSANNEPGGGWDHEREIQRLSPTPVAPEPRRDYDSADAHANLTCDCVSMEEHETRYLAAPAVAVSADDGGPDDLVEPPDPVIWEGAVRCPVCGHIETHARHASPSADDGATRSVFEHTSRFHEHTACEGCEDASPSPEPPTALRAALEAIEKATKVVDDLCHGRIRWTMRVPAEPDRDPDLVISRALALAKSLLAASPRPAPLNVEWLAMAMTVVHERAIGEGVGVHPIDARAIATAYLAIAEKEAGNG